VGVAGGGPEPARGVGLAQDPRRLGLAGAYLAGGLGLFALAWAVGGWALWLLWPSQSLLFVALAYGVVGERLFQKDERGRMSLAARALLLPYLVGARINAWFWTGGLPDSEVVAGVRLGRQPTRAPARPVLDLTAELPAPDGGEWHCLPTLDLVTPGPAVLVEAARRIEHLKGREVLVCCALGLSRSASAVATWLAHFGGHDVDGAIAVVRAVRPRVVLGPDHHRAITEAVRVLREGAGSPER
jgi:hypothetical protein